MLMKVKHRIRNPDIKYFFDTILLILTDDIISQNWLYIRCLESKCHTHFVFSDASSLLQLKEVNSSPDEHKYGEATESSKTYTFVFDYASIFTVSPLPWSFSLFTISLQFMSKNVSFYSSGYKLKCQRFHFNQSHFSICVGELGMVVLFYTW